jgi:hypothetical protein
MDLTTLKPGESTVYYTGVNIAFSEVKHHPMQLYRQGLAELTQRKTGTMSAGCNVYDYIITMRHTPRSQMAMKLTDDYFTGLYKSKSN